MLYLIGLILKFIFLFTLGWTVANFVISQSKYEFLEAEKMLIIPYLCLAFGAVGVCIGWLIFLLIDNKIAWAVVIIACIIAVILKLTYFKWSGDEVYVKKYTEEPLEPSNPVVDRVSELANKIVEENNIEDIHQADSEEVKEEIEEKVKQYDNVWDKFFAEFDNYKEDEKEINLTDIRDIEEFFE